MYNMCTFYFKFFKLCQFYHFLSEVLGDFFSFSHDVKQEALSLKEWAYDEEHELILTGLLCLDMSEIRSSDLPRLMKCHGSGGSQQWTLGKSNRLYQVSVGQCLAVVDTISPKGYVAMAICDGSQSQQWQLEG
ncbi:unnamed protein product [Oncorhynchus mykiss]|uniref:Ricin B lectin domain-containing protein n=1 Tax=Oncorhynchus mykiss TaxID=8022 RepID=A0A060VWW4_ONCMY|nr:unnamed protein product [Oncorhynchus mykiss]